MKICLFSFKECFELKLKLTMFVCGKKAEREREKITFHHRIETETYTLHTPQEMEKRRMMN